MTTSPEKRKEILKQAGIYTLGTQLTQLITLFAAVLSRRFLGPTQTGIWSALQILVDYSKYATMGVLDAAAREIPLCVGRKDSLAADALKNLTFTFIVISSTLIAVGLLLAGLLLRGHLRPEIFYGICFVAAVIFLQRINNLLVALLRCYKKFEIEAVFMIASAIVNAILVAFLTYRFKIYGFIWALILSFIFNIVFLLFLYDYKFRWALDSDRLKPLIQYGLPLMALGIGMTVIRSIDKIMIAKFLGFEDLGFYSIALMACSYISNFSISVAIVLVPHFQEKFGYQKNPHHLEPYLMKSSKAFALTLPIMIGLAWVGAPLGVALVLPKFANGIGAMKILSLSLFFIAQAQPFHDFLITIKKHTLIFPILAGTVMAAVASDWVVIQLGWGIKGVAASTVGVFFLYFALVYFTAARFFSFTGRSFQPFMKRCLVFLYLVVILGAGQYVLFHHGRQPFRAFFTGLLFFTLAYVPLLLILNRSFGLGALLAEKLQFKTKRLPGEIS